MNLVPVRHAPLMTLLLALLLTGAAGAIGLSDALDTADERTAVVNAVSTLRDAERTLERTEADPLALRMDVLQARQAVALAAAELRAARLQARFEIASAYTEAREADLRLDVAERARALAERSVEVARLRLERGAGTQLDVDDAEGERADARANVDRARNGRELARSNLASLTGLEVEELAPVPDARVEAPLPALAAYLEALDQHPTVLQARQGLEQARVGLSLLDPAYAPVADIEAAELQVEQAREGVTESERGIRLQVRSLHDAAAGARESMAVARDALANAESREEVERQRLEAGLISEIAFQQTRLATASARVDAMAAEHAYLRARLELEAEAAVHPEATDDR